MSAGIAVALAAAVLLAACAAQPSDRQDRVEQLTENIRTLPGVSAAYSNVASNGVQGPVHFRLGVDVADDVTAEELATITSRYLDGIRTLDHSGYQTELDVHGAGDVFAVDSGALPVTNPDQVIEQARQWTALRGEFSTALVTLHAAIVHPTGPAGPGALTAGPDLGHLNYGSIELADPADYSTVADTAEALAMGYPGLNVGTWTISAGPTEPADITASGRLPIPAELSLWRQLNADQTIPHADALHINAPLRPPVWIAEQPKSSTSAATIALARQHLPVVAALPAPVLYTSSDRIQAPRSDDGLATGPVAITVGGCTQRTYRPAAPEHALIAAYEKCRSAA